MDRYKHICLQLAGLIPAAFEGNKLVPGTGHNHLVAAVLVQEICQLPRYGQHHVFLPHAAGTHGAGIFTAVAGVEGEWGWLLSGLLGVAVLAGPLFLIWFIHPQGMGFGDVRLAVLLGWNVGFYAGTPMVGAAILALICIALSALVGIVYGIVAMGVRGRGAKVPFGPALVAAALFCMAMAGPVLDPFVG